MGNLLGGEGKGWGDCGDTVSVFMERLSQKKKKNNQKNEDDDDDHDKDAGG